MASRMTALMWEGTGVALDAGEADLEVDALGQGLDAVDRAVNGAVADLAVIGNDGEGDAVDVGPAFRASGGRLFGQSGGSARRAGTGCACA